MKKFLLILLAVLLTAVAAYAQVSISNPASAPDPSAMLDIKSANRGLLMPRVALRTDVVSPATGLVVYETTSNAVWMYNGTAWVQLVSSGGAQWVVNGANIYNGNTGNVGIGLNTNINKKLTVLGDALLVNPTSVIGATLGMMAGTGLAGTKINFIRADSSIVGSITASVPLNRFTLQQGSNDNQLVLSNNGNVGINQNVPTERLDVSGNIRSRDTITADNDLEALQDIRAGDDIRAADRIDAGGVIEGHGISSIGSLYVTGTSLVEGNLTAHAAATVTGNITSNTGMTINDPAGTLAFKASNVDKGFVQLSGDNLRVGTYSSNTTGKLVVRTGGADRLFVDENGNMGFNTSVPLSKIQVLTGSDASLTSHGFLMLGAVNGSNIVMDNNEIVARSNGAASSLIMQNDGGTVRIGSIAVPAGYKFAVNGKIICEEMRVQLTGNWPDYVFKKDYNLLPLSKLKKFIEQNNHLPNIPKASVVEQEGMEMGAMQTKLMEKVEELTLYILDLQKQIDELKAKTNSTKRN
jgi:hypothetical protein